MDSTTPPPRASRQKRAFTLIRGDASAAEVFEALDRLMRGEPADDPEPDDLDEDISSA